MSGSNVLATDLSFTEAVSAQKLQEYLNAPKVNVVSNSPLHTNLSDNSISNQAIDIAHGIKHYADVIHNVYKGKPDYTGIKTDSKITDMAGIMIPEAYLKYKKLFGQPIVVVETNNGFSISVSGVDTDHCKTMMGVNMGNTITMMTVNGMSLSNTFGEVKTPSTQEATSSCSLPENVMKWEFL